MKVPQQQGPVTTSKAQAHSSPSQSLSLGKEDTSTSEFQDLRPEAIAQRQLRDAIANKASSANKFEMPVQRAVSKTAKVDESNETTGNMNYGFQWRATEGHKNGYIIQNIIRKETIHQGDEKKEENMSYWEAWRVVEGEVYGGGRKLSSGNHDSWYQKSMPPGSHGTIEMGGYVYFSTSAPHSFNIGDVLYAGGLLSSSNPPYGIQMIPVLNEIYNFSWDRRLQGGNVDKIIASVLKEELEFAEREELLDEEYDWDGFVEEVKSYDESVDLDSEIIISKVKELL